MHETSLLQKLLLKSCTVHRSRLNSLMVGVQSLMIGQKLSVAGLGRSLRLATKTKYDIARMDYLVGNENLFNERKQFYTAILSSLLPKHSRPLIAVDWSSATIGERYQVLRAGLIVNGRSFPVYEEIHPLSKYNNATVHQQFLSELASCLPPNCCPIIISDAGFFGLWFKEVLEQGWDFVGRIRSNMGYSQEGKVWENALNLRAHATATPAYAGKFLLTKRHKLISHLYTYKKKPLNRKQTNLCGEKSARNVSVKSAERERDPWILASSLELPAEDIKNIYYRRMQIEESFRDIKSPQFGFGLRNARSNGIVRISNLFLIAMLATFLLWLIGCAIRMTGKDRGYQANSIQTRNVLSIFFLGRQAVLDHRIRLKLSDLNQALIFISKEVVYAS